jgi:hypothetical protein
VLKDVNGMHRFKAIDVNLLFGTDDETETVFDGMTTAATSKLHELPPGKWRSLGRHLDYTEWADRDRFVKLDQAIRLLPDSSSYARRKFRD